MAFCRVSYRDIEHIEHSTEVTAKQPVRGRRNGDSAFPARGCLRRLPAPGSEFSVKVLPDSPVTYTIGLNRVETFALHGTVAGPKDIVRKERIRKLLRLA